MAQATDKQVRDLEAALSTQFYYLVQGAAFRIAIARKYGLDSAAFKKYNAFFVPIVKNWVIREVKYERINLKQNIRGIIATGDLQWEDFFYSAQLPKLDMLVKKWNAEPPTTGGIGWVAIAIFAVAAIVAAISAVVITDDLTTTTQERESLLKTTQQTAQELGLTPEQAAGLISQTQAEASKGSGIGDTIKWVLFGALAIFGIQQYQKSQ